MSKLLGENMQNVDIEIENEKANIDLQNLNSICIVMELMDIDLAKLFESRAMLFTEKYLLKILYNSICAIAFLHEANIVHRDIKPSNLLIGPDLNIKIGDLGSSRNIIS